MVHPALHPLKRQLVGADPALELGALADRALQARAQARQQVGHRRQGQLRVLDVTPGLPGWRRGLGCGSCHQRIRYRCGGYEVGLRLDGSVSGGHAARWVRCSGRGRQDRRNVDRRIFVGPRRPASGPPLGAGYGNHEPTDLNGRSPLQQREELPGQLEGGRPRALSVAAERRQALEPVAPRSAVQAEAHPPGGKLGACRADQAHESSRAAQAIPLDAVDHERVGGQA